MDWTEAHDSLLIREILIIEPFQFKSSTVKRGQAWSQIAEILNSVELPSFRVNQRSVRERFSHLEKTFTKKISNEEKASGISPPELTENENGLEEIICKKKEAALEQENENESSKEAQQVERLKAHETRKRCLETFAETKQRAQEEDNEEKTTPKRRVRGSGSGTISYLREKSEKDSELRKEELNLKRIEEERLRNSSESQQQMFVDIFTQQKDQMKELVQQQQAMQQQQQLVMAQLQSQQQTQQLFMTLIEQLKK